MRTTRRFVIVVSIALLASTFVVVASPVGADHTADPGSVTIAGSLQDELGCPGDWQPECANTHLAFDSDDDLWQATFTVPEGSFEYKAALDDAWDENYGAGGIADGANIGLTTGAETDVKFYYDHKSHWVTDNETSVIATAAGDFQSELGCPGDWQPECLRSWLQDANGDGLYEFVTDQIPAGDYQGKVALDEAWDTSFPGDNVAFTVQETGNLVTISYDSATNDVVIDVQSSGLEPGDEDLVRAPVRSPVSDENMYFVMPDRFINGDQSNDAGGDGSGDPLVNGLLPEDKGYFHGGDIAGLEANLDYLASLGITAIWMTPQFTNNPVQGDGTVGGSSAGYHGYWQTDYTEIDPHFGTNAEMQDLVDSAHALGMSVFFDIVANHTGDVITYEEGIFTYRNKDDYPYTDADGVVFDDSDYAGTGTFPDLDPDTSFPYTPTFADAGDDAVKAPAWLNDPIYYHNRGDSTFAGENSLYGDFFGLDDLFTEHHVVQDGLIDIFKGMITDFDIDGFRIDTVKHVNDEFWEAFVPEIETHAAGLGKTDFAMFGEVFSSDPEFASRFTTELDLPAVLDFGFMEASRSFAASGTDTDALRDFFANDDYFTDENSNASFMPKFASNHDVGRIGYFIDQANPGAADDERVARSTLNHALLYFTRGYPVVYYGDEQGFVGDGGDKDARQDVMPSLVPSYNDDDLIGTADTTADENLDQTHPLYQVLSDFATLRDDHVALRQGAQLHRYSEASDGIFAFSRIERSEQVEYVVAANNSEAADTATFQTDTPDTMWTEVWPGGGAAIGSDASGELTVDVPPLDFVVYRADAPMALPAAAPGIAVTAPSSGSDVTGRVQVAADVGSESYAEVTFAVSIDGGEYVPFATDDNAPYSAFYDVAGLPVGTPLLFKAIVADAAGNLNAAKVDGVVGDETDPGGDAGMYAIVHYVRDDGDYGDHTTGDYNDFWGLHLWGDTTETIEWTSPKPFLGEDSYGRFAWIELADNATEIGFIVHRGDTKDGTDADRFFDPSVTPEIWLRSDDATTYTSEAEAQGYVTIRYHRDDGDYGDPTSDDYNDFWGVHLWGDAIDPGEGTEWTTPKKPTGFDDYGAYWDVQIVDASQPVNFIIHRGDTKDPGPDQSFVPIDSANVWIESGDETIFTQEAAALGMATLHYHRPDGDYGDTTSDDYNDFWGLHTWGGADDPGWTTPRKPADFDVFGPVFDVPLFEDASELSYILHRGDEKDPGPDQTLVFDKWGNEVWQLQGADVEAPYILPILSAGGTSKGDLTEQRAHWVSEDTIVWDAATETGATYSLHWSPDGSLALSDGGVEGGESVALTASGTYTQPVGVEGFRQLEGLPTLQIDAADAALVPDVLKGQIAVAATDDGGVRIDATGLQIPGVLDDLYAFDGDLGVTWDGATPTLRVWAPSAVDVDLMLFTDSDPNTAGDVHEMLRDDATGTWSIIGDGLWNGAYYLYEVDVYAPTTGQVETNLVTDPYSLSLSMNSTRSQIVDLTDAALSPTGWDAVDKPALVNPEDIAIYELHVRDFSANDATVDEELRGTFKAFTVDDSDGLNHLSSLADAGLTHVHLLPTFDIATINEDKAQWQAPDETDLASYPPDAEDQQASVTAYEDLDGFNWGYDPLHYTTPEGSYATNPDGTARIVEFREMVQSLNNTGLRVLQDVVYNHTNASGQADKSVLDRIVPGYYHRLDDTGTVETSTCCANTATEHAMMQKLMVDSVVTWATEYKVDGFRFDLMGHHTKQNMVDVRAALDALTVVSDGVDGSSIYLYGEGWNFGEVADNVRFDQATQLNMAGTGIGTFSDRLRDAVRGGGPFDSGDSLLLNQGFINGGWYDPNEAVVAAGVPEQTQLDELLLSADQIRVGLAGNLADYSFIDRNGDTVTGKDVDYNGSPAGYTADPQENIVYVSAHDNQTLFDISQYHNPVAASMEDRVRVQNLGFDLTVLAQGVPFFHAGVDMLRSKSLDRDSFNSGDWFNRLDFGLQETAWGAGLPVAGKNVDNWPLMKPLLANPDLAPEPEHIAAAANHAAEMLAVRDSSPLFRLTTETDVMERVTFHNTGADQVPGLIVMSISDDVGVDLDPLYETVVSMFNASDEPQMFTIGGFAGQSLDLHPVLAKSADPVVVSASYDKATGTFTIPARTTAVFTDDVTAPVVEAEMELLQRGRGVAWFLVSYSCTDGDPDAEVSADINGVPVPDGQIVRLINHPYRTDSFEGPNRIDILGRTFLLTVTCTDSSGNSTTTEVIPNYHG